MIPDTILREMLGDDLADATFAARERLADPSIIARIGSPDGRVPGLVYVERGGDVAVKDLGHDDALIYLGQMA